MHSECNKDEAMQLQSHLEVNIGHDLGHRSTLRDIGTVDPTSARPLSGTVVGVVSIVIRHTEGICVARANAGDWGGVIVISLVEIRRVVERQIATECELAVGCAGGA